LVVVVMARMVHFEAVGSFRKLGETPPQKETSYYYFCILFLGLPFTAFLEAFKGQPAERLPLLRSHTS
jgi:hypothetical protein